MRFIFVATALLSFVIIAGPGCASTRTEDVKHEDHGTQPGYGATDGNGGSHTAYPKRCPSCAKGYESHEESCPSCSVPLEPWESAGGDGDDGDGY